MNSYTVNRYNVPTPGATSQSISIPHTGAGSTDTKTFGAFQDRTKVIYITVIGSGFSAVDTTIAHRLQSGNQYYFNAELVSQAKFKKLPSASATAIMYASELTN